MGKISNWFRKSPQTTLDAFEPICREILAVTLASNGFKATKFNAVHSYRKQTYRKGEQYVTVCANEEPRDGFQDPETGDWRFKFCTIVLGEGREEFPEGDWNKIALWQLAKASGIGGGDGLTWAYVYDDIEGMRVALSKIRSDLERYATDFLSGDVAAFRSVRAELTRGRQPYRIGRPGPSGRYEFQNDPASEELKRRYSEDNPDEDHNESD